MPEPQPYQPDIPDLLQQFILELSPTSKVEQRQAAGVGGGLGQQPAAPTQLSPITTYNIGGGVVIYTQIFAATPDQWATMGAGTIGLGSITGKVGVVKSSNPAPTIKPEIKFGAVVGAGIGAALLL